MIPSELSVCDTPLARRLHPILQNLLLVAALRLNFKDFFIGEEPGHWLLGRGSTAASIFIPPAKINR